MKTLYHVRQAVAALAAAACLMTGCDTLDKHLPGVPRFDQPKPGDVRRVMVLWADGVDIRPDPTRGGVPTPGLAGRVFLFGSEVGEALAATGSLRVQLHDDAQSSSEAVAPREVWTIDQANLDLVRKKDGVGWGYNIWLPWSTYRPDVKRVSLTVCYTPDQGVPIWTAPTALVVAGAQSPSVVKQSRSSRRGATARADSAAERLTQVVDATPKPNPLISE